MEYAVMIEEADDGSFSAYVPDLPGCVSCGDTRQEAEQLIKEAVALHIESLQQHGEPVPRAKTVAIRLDIPSRV